jgi:hypothetical protein
VVEEEIVTHYGVSKITRTQYVCPNPECQKKVDIKLAEQKKIGEEWRRHEMERSKSRGMKQAGG